MTEREKCKAIVADYMMGTMSSNDAAERIMSVLGMDGLTGEIEEAGRILEDGVNDGDPLDAILDEIDASWELDPLADDDDDDEFYEDDDFDEEPDNGEVAGA